MHDAWVRLGLISALLTASCGADDLGEGADGGATTDGAIEADASLNADAGVGTDIGSVVDSGQARDAGQVADSGSVSDSGASNPDAAADASTSADAEPSDSGLVCTLCHGDPSRPATAVNPARAAAPPRGAEGELLKTTRAVGAHDTHLEDGPLRLAVPCTECHVVPTDLSHRNGVATMTFGPLAGTDGANPAWNGTSCSNVYCHGATLVGGTVPAPTWTRVDNSQTECGACHGLPPNTSRHERHVLDRDKDCFECHGAGYAVLGVSPTVSVESHINGTVEMGGAGSSIITYQASSCEPSCHIERPW